jgi:uroporphyrinogen decarboxylase
MDDLIDVVRIDGKHSYEDAILPVAQFQERYGQRVAVLGGLDVHALSTGTPESVRELTRAVIAACGPRGRYAVGSGNSIPDYVPVANYLSMVDETLEQAHRSAS